MLVVLDWIARGAALLLAGALLYSVGGPLATDDLWWHLSLGHAYAEDGPWLAADPHLFTALKAPDPNAWLFDRMLAFADAHAGLRALRLLHGAFVALILFGVWHLLRRRAESPAFASLGVAAFIVSASYRLVQLRPELATIGATILLAAFLFDRKAPIGPARGALAIGLCALWSNLHPGFLLGPVLLFAAAGGCLVWGLLGAVENRPSEWKRFRAFFLTGALGLAATGLNPSGYGALLIYTQAGVESVGQAIVIDEWRGFDPFTWPATSLPPAPLTWAMQWGLMVGTSIGIFAALRKLLRDASAEDHLEPSSAEGIDAPILIPLAAIGLLAPFLAVRFLWLALFPLLLGAAYWQAFFGAHRSEASARLRVPTFAVAAVTLTLLPLFLAYSERKSTPIGTTTERYAHDYDTDRYAAHSVWFLRDAETRGSLFHPYFMGGFLGYWLAPNHAAFVDGSLNVPANALQDYGAIQRLGHANTSEAIEEILDRRSVDFYIGVGLPLKPRPGRPWRYTTMDLAASPNWMLVFRSLRSAVYMRRGPSNAENLDRIESYYRERDVPFDRERGLDVFGALERSSDWAIANGLAPFDYPQLKQAAEGAHPRLAPRLRGIARDRLARTYAVLGLCDQSLRVDALDSRTSEARVRRESACGASSQQARSRSPRHTWLTPVEAGQIRGVERSPEIRRNRAALSR